MPEPHRLQALEEVRRSGERLVRRLKDDPAIADEARFLRSWFDKPLVTGAVSPSSRALATRMASYVDPSRPGPVIELGPGTGPVTDALIRRGVAEERLVLVEFNPEFCDLLATRFPKARIVRGDAYALAREMIAGNRDAPIQPAAAVISSLPLFTKPEASRLKLLRSSLEMMGPGAPFIQFTYATVSPMPLGADWFRAEVSPRVWLNLPPACVWVYRLAGAHN